MTVYISWCGRSSLVKIHLFTVIIKSRIINKQIYNCLILFIFGQKLLNFIGIPTEERVVVFNIQQNYYTCQGYDEMDPTRSFHVWKIATRTESGIQSATVASENGKMSQRTLTCELAMFVALSSFAWHCYHLLPC